MGNFILITVLIKCLSFSCCTLLNRRPRPSTGIASFRFTGWIVHTCKSEEAFGVSGYFSKVSGYFSNVSDRLIRANAISTSNCCFFCPLIRRDILCAASAKPVPNHSTPPALPSAVSFADLISNSM